MGVMFVYREPSGRGYGKSLIIPLSYVVVGFLVTVLWGKIVNLVGEEGMVLAVFWLQFVIAFVAVAVINFVIYLVRRNKVGRKPLNNEFYLVN